MYPEAGTVTAYNPSWIEQIGNVFNSWFADRKIKNDWMQSPKGQAFQAELARMNATEEDVGIKWGPLLDWALFAGALAIPNDLIVGDLVTLANLLVKGRVSWALLRRFIGKKGVEKLYNYFMQQNIQVPQLNLRSSIKPNPSSVNIASAQGPVDNSILNSRNTAVRKHTTFVIVDSNSIG